MELSGHEWQRAEKVLGWGCQRGTEGGARQGGGQDPVVSTHSSDRQPYSGELGGGFSLIWGEEGQLSKCMGMGQGGILPLWPALVNNLISLSLSLSLSLFFCLFLSV